MDSGLRVWGAALAVVAAAALEACGPRGPARAPNPPRYQGQPRSLIWAYNRATPLSSRPAPGGGGPRAAPPIHPARGEATLPAKAGEL
ncbi:hypothetical protein ATI61_101445 [Archangium gephyra]|uniref:Uncharacterized protein n=2 Tax=Archangium gephyra TaxID=48 RepID=A0ABX9KBP1_9BACT|nr:hypothetical protein ATI61_101445 [Archangium gephyra]